MALDEPGAPGPRKSSRIPAIVALLVIAGIVVWTVGGALISDGGEDVDICQLDIVPVDSLGAPLPDDEARAWWAENCPGLAP